MCIYGEAEGNLWYYCTGAIHLVLFEAGSLAGLELTKQTMQLASQ